MFCIFYLASLTVLPFTSHPHSSSRMIVMALVPISSKMLSSCLLPHFYGTLRYSSSAHLLRQIELIQGCGYVLSLAGQVVGSQFLRKNLRTLVFTIGVLLILSSSSELRETLAVYTRYTTSTVTYGPLSTFLHSHGIQQDQTLFVTMAGGMQYIEAAINFNNWINSHSAGISLFYVWTKYAWKPRNVIQPWRTTGTCRLKENRNPTSTCQ